MADHRVDDLRLRLPADSNQRANLREAAERFVAAILEAVGDRLESRWPGRLIFLPRMPLRWSIREAELADRAAISRYADEIAASVEDPEPHRTGTPVGERTAVVFRDEAHWWAGYLSARAAGGGEERAWVYETLRAKGIGVAALPGRGREFAIAVLRELAEAGTLLRVIGIAEPETIEGLCDFLIPVQAGGPEPVAGGFIRRPEHSRLSDLIQTLPRGLPLRTQSLLLYAEAARILGISTPHEEVAAVVSSVLDEWAAERGMQSTSVGARESQAALQSMEPVLQTQFGSLFYLLALALELEIGEALWKTCFPEGAILAHCAAALLGVAAEGDPAPALFGGVRASDNRLPEVTAQQHEEVATVLVASLSAAIPRQSLARLPEVVLHLTPGAAARMLVAAERDSPFAIFVWPAPDARHVETGLRAFLAGWPASAPPVLATPSIAEVEGRVRVRAVPGLKPPSELFLPGMGSVLTSALIAQVVGALCQLFVARGGLDAPPSAAALVERYLAVPAKIDLAPREMRVILPMSRIEIPLRRSGLDRDPGWVPWLERTVRFVFT